MLGFFVDLAVLWFTLTGHISAGKDKAAKGVLFKTFTKKLQKVLIFPMPCPQRDLVLIVRISEALLKSHRCLVD